MRPAALEEPPSDVDGSTPGMSYHAREGGAAD